MSIILLICIVTVFLNIVGNIILYSVGHVITYERTDDYFFKGIGKGIFESIIMILIYGTFVGFVTAILAMFGIIVN